jgi:hypothetical protein
MKKRTLTEDALRKVHIEVDGSVVALVVSSSWAGAKQPLLIPLFVENEPTVQQSLDKIASHLVTFGLYIRELAREEKK